MISGIYKLKAAIFSPLTIINVTLFIFAGFAIIQLLTLDSILSSFVSVQNKFAFYQIVTILVFVLYVNFLYKIAKPIKLKIPEIVTTNKAYNLIIFFQVIFFCLIIFLFNQKYSYFEYIYSIVNSSSINEAYLLIAKFGYELVNGGGLFYYTVLYYLPIFLFALSFNTESQKFRNILILCSLLTILLYCLAGRREVLIIIPIIIGILAKSNKTFLLKLATAFVIFLGLVIFLLLARLKSEGFDFISYINTQEFYPYTYGSYLTVDKLKLFDLDELKRLFPFYIITGEDNLSFYTRKEHFNYFSNGPTVTLLYPLVAFFPLSSIILLLIFGWAKGIHKRIFIENDFSISHILLYTILIVKLFTLTRNGEFGLFFWDLLLYLFVMSPLVFIKKR
jgi:hypothetical protein